MKTSKILTIVALAVGIFGFIFAATGTGLYLGLALPETRDLRIAANESYTVQTATFTDIVSSNTFINNIRMYRLQFTWNGDSATTNPNFTRDEALTQVGETVQIRVNDSGRAVPVNYERSVLSTLGFVFVGVFGGIGAVALLIALVCGLTAVRKKSEEKIR